jgi:hypothetical protein
MKMSISANLFMSPERADLGDVKDTIEKLFETKIEIDTQRYPDYQVWNFKLDKKNWRTMFVHMNSRYGGFTGTLFSLGSDDQSIEFFEKIASIYGGLLQENDCKDDWRDISGKLDSHDGLSYFVKYAFTHHDIDPRNLTALAKVIDDWQESMKKNSSLSTNIRGVKEAVGAK